MKNTTMFAAGAVFALVVGSGTAVAATGGKFILGQSNSANRTSTLTNSAGTALSLKSKAGTPSLKVSNKVKVPNLNADLLDGLDPTAFALTSGSTGYFQAASVGYDTDVNGVNDVFIATAVCPAGTKRTGGGAIDFTITGVTFVNSPDTGNSWTVAVLTDNATVEDPTDVKATVVCYNPRGSVPGATARTVSKPQVHRVADQVLASAAAKVG